MVAQGDKFKTRVEMVEGEILGAYPQGQTVPVSLNDGAYQIIMGGFKGVISKQLFETIFELEAVEPLVKPSVLKKPIKPKTHTHIDVPLKGGN